MSSGAGANRKDVFGGLLGDYGSDNNRHWNWNRYNNTILNSIQLSWYIMETHFIVKYLLCIWQTTSWHLKDYIIVLFMSHQYRYISAWPPSFLLIIWHHFSTIISFLIFFWYFCSFLIIWLSVLTSNFFSFKSTTFTSGIVTTIVCWSFVLLSSICLYFSTILCLCDLTNIIAHLPSASFIFCQHVNVVIRTIIHNNSILA